MPPGPDLLAYPSDDLTTYQITTVTPLYQFTLGDLTFASGDEPGWAGLWVPRYTQWSGDVGGIQTTIKIMCSPADPNFLSGPGTQQTAGGVLWTLTKCMGEQRQ